MSRILYLVLLVFFTGCSYKSPKLHFLSKVEKDEIYKLLKLQPQALQLAIEEELNSSILSSKLRIQKNSMQKVWFDFILEANTEELSVDEKFENIAGMVSQNNTELSTLFASNLSKYLSDTDYLCKEPMYYSYFQERYDKEGDVLSCEKEVPFSVLSKKGLSKVVWIDPKRVSSIHILFAGNGEGIISKFGHISMRLIVCPIDDYSEAGCNTNLYEHIVLGYRAHINELKIDTLKGLVGDYRAYLFANKFMDVYKEYAIGEFRDLYSLPLKLNEKQREDIVRSMSEIHWAYAGDYKFLTKNCSTLMQNFLKTTWKEFSDNPDLSEVYWRPDNFFSELKKNDLTKHESLEDLSKAEAEGYFFPNTGPVYEEALEVVKKSMLEPKFNNIEEYISMNPKKRYKESKADRTFYERLQLEKYLRDAQLLLEELSIVRFESYLMAEMAYYFEKNSIDKINWHMKKQLNKEEFKIFSKCMLEPITALMKPIKREDGIPTFEKLAKKKTLNKCSVADNGKQMQKIKIELEHIDSDSWRAIEVSAYYVNESKKNVEKYLSLGEI
ncbi:MAG: hypothetical protein COA44_06575 [Arcobacter sp.]|nr:MAG: hypothetical protein COA44_06575 [Arcobacter sp.]